MKLTFKNQLNLVHYVLAVFIIIATSCSKTEDLYKGNDTPLKEESDNILTSLMIPSDFNWSSTKDINVKLGVNDLFEGKYYYSLHLYDKNPNNEDAVLLDAGYVKKGQDWSTKITIPSALTEIYIKETDPLNEVKYYSVKIDNNTIADINKKNIQNLTKEANVSSNLKANVSEPKNPHDVLIGKIIMTPFSYVFEDSWPNVGDYDMNDFVVDIQIEKEINYYNMVKNVILKNSIRAVGAKRKLSAAIHLPRFMAASINKVTYSKRNWIGIDFPIEPQIGVESGQTNAVVPITDDAHLSLGINYYTQIFTSETLTPAKQDITIEFYGSGISSFSYSDINPFLVNYVQENKGYRNEIHLPGNQPTDKVNQYVIKEYQNKKNNSSLSKYDPYITKANTPFAFSIPTSFKYPSEGKKITNAYPKFLSWVLSGGVLDQDWYNKFSN